MRESVMKHFNPISLLKKTEEDSIKETRCAILWELFRRNRAFKCDLEVYLKAYKTIVFEYIDSLKGEKKWILNEAKTIRDSGGDEAEWCNEVSSYKHHVVDNNGRRVNLWSHALSHIIWDSKWQPNQLAWIGGEDSYDPNKTYMAESFNRRNIVASFFHEALMSRKSYSLINLLRDPIEILDYLDCAWPKLPLHVRTKMLSPDGIYSDAPVAVYENYPEEHMLEDEYRWSRLAISMSPYGCTQIEAEKLKTQLNNWVDKKAKGINKKFFDSFGSFEIWEDFLIFERIKKREKEFLKKYYSHRETDRDIQSIVGEITWYFTSRNTGKNNPLFAPQNIRNKANKKSGIIVDRVRKFVGDLNQNGLINDVYPEFIWRGIPFK